MYERNEIYRFTEALCIADPLFHAIGSSVSSAMLTGRLFSSIAKSAYHSFWKLDKPSKSSADRFTEWQHGWVWKDLWRASRPTSLLKQHHIELVQEAFEYVQEDPQPPWPTLSALGHHHSVKVFPRVQKEPLMFQFVPIASGCGTGHHWPLGSVLIAPFLHAF